MHFCVLKRQIVLIAGHVRVAGSHRVLPFYVLVKVDIYLGSLANF